MGVQRVQTVVIGAGPGGYVAAIRLGQLGVETVVVERERVGGICLNHGCIPSKALIHGAKLVSSLKEGEDLGVSVGDVRVDLAKMVTWKDGVVKRLTDGVAKLIKANGSRLVSGEARLVGPNEVVVTPDGGDVERFVAQQVVVATGARPIELGSLPFTHPNVLNSRQALALKELPEQLVVVGGGYIGMELGMVFAKLGSKVTIVEAMDRILAGMTADLVRPVARAAKAMGIRILTQAKATTLSGEGSRVTLEVQTSDGGTERIEANKVLVAVGMRPNSDNLGLEEIGVERDRAGFVQTGPDLRTNVEGVYAIGDVRGGMLLAHKAYREAETAAEIIAGHRASLDDVGAIPWVVFTEPEVAGVGLSEEQAKAQGFEVRIGRFPFAANGRAMTIDRTEGFVRVVADAKTDRILGMEAVGPDVSEMSGEMVLALEMGCTTRDVSSVVHVHPTLSEALPEACLSSLGMAIHVANRKPR